MSKSKFYQLDDILSYNQKINMICGDRFAGKTTSVQKYAIKRTILTRCRSQFAVFVKYKDDIDKLCPTYFNNVMLLYPDYILRYSNGAFFFRKKKSEVEKICGYVFPINLATKYKSTGYPFIDTIIEDEFLNLEGSYIKRTDRPFLEVELFISLYESIARGQGKQIRENVKAFLISNNYYINNPYYNYYDLIEKITDDPTKRFYKNKEYNLILEVTTNGVKSGIGKSDFDGSQFVDLKNEIQIVREYKPKKIYYQFTTDNKNYLSISFFNNSFYIFKGKNKIDKKAFTITTSEIARLNYINIKLFKTFTISNKIKKLFLLNKLYYDSYESYINFKNIMELLW